MKKDLIKEARRYVDNADKTINENARYNKELHLYEDDKYVRAAGHYLWHSVLLALVNSSYNVMHLSMDYDGNSRKAVCDDGFRLANDIINRCEKMLA